MTRTPLSKSKGQRSRSPGRFIHRRVGASGSCSGTWAWERVGRGKLLLRCRLHGGGREALRRPRGRTGAGAYRGCRSPAYRLLLLLLLLLVPPETHLNSFSAVSRLNTWLHYAVNTGHKAITVRWRERLRFCYTVTEQETQLSPTNRATHFVQYAMARLTS